MMPLIVKNFNWHQTHDLVSIHLNIKGIKADKTDILTSKNYIRVHFHPYIFEVFLLEEVEDVSGSCRIDEDSSLLLIQLPKVSVGQDWCTLERKDLDRLQKKQIREAAVSTSHKRHEEEATARAHVREEQKRMTVREQMRLDEEERFRIAEIKAEEGKKAVADIGAWTANKKLIPGKTSSFAQLPPHDQLPGSASSFLDRLPTRSSSSGEVSLEELVRRGPSTVTILSSDEEDSNGGEEAGDIGRGGSRKLCSVGRRMYNGAASKYLERRGIWTEAEVPAPCNKSTEEKGSSGDCPGIRAQSTISFKFTPRDFITPSRESTAPQEQEWLAKQAEARRKSGFNDADLRDEERDPSWLLDKGMSLMKSACHLGAISAFSLGMKLAPKMPELYVERSRAHLALRNCIKAVEDASQALELLTPKVSANAVDRLKSHVCRGTAFEELKLIGEAMLDFKEALLLSPQDTELRAQVQQLQTQLDRQELEVSSEED